MTATRTRRAPRGIPPGEGASLNVAGSRYTPKVTGEDTSEAFCMIEATVPPGTSSPLHISHHEDRVIYVVEGVFAFLMEGRSFTATAGGCAFLPRGTVHNFTNIGTAAGRLLICHTPSGHERYGMDPVPAAR